MRFTKTIIIIAILLILAGSAIIYWDQSKSKTRICEYRIRQAYTINCTWNQKYGTQVWTLDVEKDLKLFTELKMAMLADLQTDREEATSVETPEFNLLILDRNRDLNFEFQIHTGQAAWVECNGGTYTNLSHTEKFLRDHTEAFRTISLPKK